MGRFFHSHSLSSSSSSSSTSIARLRICCEAFVFVSRTDESLKLSSLPVTVGTVAGAWLSVSGVFIRGERVFELFARLGDRPPDRPTLPREEASRARARDWAPSARRGGGAHTYPIRREKLNFGIKRLIFFNLLTVSRPAWSRSVVFGLV